MTEQILGQNENVTGHVAEQAKKVNNAPAPQMNEMLQGDSELPFFTRITDTPLFIDRAQLLMRSLANRPPLPTQILFGEQESEALALTHSYISGMENIFKILEKHGMNKSVESYAFRLPHFIMEAAWVNVIVRLQFATSLHALWQTLNDNLSSDAQTKWGVLEYDLEKNEYSVNGEVLNFGDRLDVFTVEEKLLSNVVFSSQEVLNCKPIAGDTLPVFNIPLDEIENIDFESIQKRATNGIRDDQHLIGVDAWSFTHGLLYRIKKDDEDIIEISTDILAKQDRDPRIDYRKYTEIGNLLNDEDLPFGLNRGTLGALRDYYCKNHIVFNGFYDNIKALYEDPMKFRETLTKQNLGAEFIIDNIYAMTFLLDGKSKLLRVKLVMMDGTTKDAVTITRPLSMTNLGTFARFNPRPMYFQEITYDMEENKERGFLDRIRGKNKLKKVDSDKFTLVDGDPIQSQDVLGYITKDCKAYYFTEESSLAKDDKFAFYHRLVKEFKTFDRALQEKHK